jgi:S-layer protein (TIGR01564 family)
MSLYYPDEQVRAIVAVGSAPVFTTGAAGQTVATQSIAPIKTMVGKLDTEFLALSAADQKAKNVISVGGPAVNRVTAQLLGKTFPAYGAASGLTANTALIKLVENAFSGSKVALVVAGWEASNTRAATSALQNFETAALTGTEKVL